ncbi:MAG: hypothetical protein GAK30_03676 [Paracidovorax wautersii]|uniref:4-carboxymuconolactone decarboxylase n=1 Tax=Paracidovorax wautersii TaxID=1177982 RepID=A0A7V8JNY2_9BURK|nr:MAG: hypothetical protein GAK30_03676 [Paracidovorax wautersii]
MSTASGRFPLISREQMSERQREVADDITAGPRGALKGPFLVLIHNAELAAPLQSLGEHLRFGTEFPKTIVELAVLVTAHRWSCEYEWFAHARIAAEAGVREALIRAIALGELPPDMSADEALVHRFCVEVAWDGRPGDVAMEAVLSRFGRSASLDLIALTGYYTLLAMVLNAAKVPAPAHPIPLDLAHGARRPATQWPLEGRGE